MPGAGLIRDGGGRPMAAGALRSSVKEPIIDSSEKPIERCALDHSVDDEKEDSKEPDHSPDEKASSTPGFPFWPFWGPRWVVLGEGRSSGTAPPKAAAAAAEPVPGSLSPGLSGTWEKGAVC